MKERKWYHTLVDIGALLLILAALPVWVVLVIVGMLGGPTDWPENGEP